MSLDDTDLDPVVDVKDGFKLVKEFRDDAEFCAVEVQLTVEPQFGDPLRARVIEQIVPSADADDVTDDPSFSTFSLDDDEWTLVDEYLVLEHTFDPDETVRQVYTYTLDGLTDRDLDELRRLPEVRIPERRRPEDAAADGDGAATADGGNAAVDVDDPAGTDAGDDPGPGAEPAPAPSPDPEEPTADSPDDEPELSFGPDLADGDGGESAPGTEPDSAPETEPESAPETEPDAGPETEPATPAPAGGDAPTVTALVEELESGAVPEATKRRLADQLGPHLDRTSNTERIRRLEERQTDVEAFLPVIERFVDERGTFEGTIEDLEDARERLRLVERRTTAHEDELDRLDELESRLDELVSAFRSLQSL